MDRSCSKHVRLWGLTVLVLALLGAVPPPAGAHLYWVDGSYVGRANVDATGANTQFMFPASSPAAVDIDAEHIYWVHGNNRAIGRSNLDGSGVDPWFMVLQNDPTGIAVDAGHIYWASS